MKSGKLSTPLVLAAASTMIAIGVVAWVTSGTGGDAPAAEEAAHVALLTIDDRTPERAAESFYDAWRRRAWDEAASIASGEAHAAALHKKALDAEVEDEDREMAQDVWIRLAGAELEMSFTGHEEVADGHLVLHAVASYDFAGEPYRRRVMFEVAPASATEWRVVRMELGQVLTDVPSIFAGSDSP